MKGDGSVRICGDYKVTANRAVKVDRHPIPRIEDLFTAMSGGVAFTKLDLSHAYLQLQLEEKSREYLTINTHRGLFEYTRLPFGVSSAPSIFQRTMEGLLQGIEHISIYIDDILITGRTEEEHLHTLSEVLKRLEAAGMRLKREKCIFMAPSVEYLGHRISGTGLHPTDEKVRAITLAPQPTNVSELKAFLGLINYYGKFLRNLSTVLAPLYRLLQKKVQWKWATEQQEAFDEAKTLLKSPQVLVHYSNSKKLVLSCDASPVGLGAVLSHVEDDGTEHPIGYASRSLTAAERKYAQIDKEALAIIFGVQKYHQYLYGRSFVIYTDHKPLKYLFDENRSIPANASARVQRWALMLSGYQYSIAHRPGTAQCNADSLSRLPLATVDEKLPQPAEVVLLLDRVNASLVTTSHIKAWTDKDTVLAKVRKYVLQGWPQNIGDKEVAHYANKREELSVEGNCLLWGARVVIPPQLQGKVMDEIHEGHPGMARMKTLARSYVWWPGMNSDLENKVKQCLVCQQSRKMPPGVEMQQWDWPEKPWTRVHVDHAGPFLGKLLLIMVDATSKWIETFIVSSTSTAETISRMRQAFATHGLPEVLVSDNGTAFTSKEFKDFMSTNGVKHMTTAPYHPSSNGLAERAVQTVKDGLKKLTGPLELRIPRFLFKYRVTPQSTTGIAPAELLMGRRVRTHLDLLYPTTQQRVRAQQLAQKANHAGRPGIPYNAGDRVMARNFTAGDQKWLAGKVLEREGKVMVKVQLDDGRVWRRHMDQIRRTQIAKPEEAEDADPLTMPSEQPTTEPEQPTTEPEQPPERVPEDPGTMRDTDTTRDETETPPTADGTGEQPEETASPEATVSPAQAGNPNPVVPVTPPPPPRRRSTRVHGQPDRLGW